MRYFLSLLSLLLLLSMLVSCGAKEPASTTATATPPTRVAVLFSSLVEAYICTKTNKLNLNYGFTKLTVFMYTT